MERITRIVAEEVQNLKTQCDHERENAKIMKIEADRVSLLILNSRKFRMCNC